MASDEGSQTQYPTKWLPTSRFPEDRAALPLEVPDIAWFRSNAHPTKGLPYLVWEVFWITPNVIHLAICEGWAEAGVAADGVDERAVVSHERISLETVERTYLDLTTVDGWVDFTGSVRRTDLPVFLIVSHRSGEPDAYAYNPPIRGA